MNRRRLEVMFTGKVNAEVEDGLCHEEIFQDPICAVSRYLEGENREAVEDAQRRNTM